MRSLRMRSAPGHQGRNRAYPKSGMTSTLVILFVIGGIIAGWLQTQSHTPTPADSGLSALITPYTRQHVALAQPRTQQSGGMLDTTADYLYGQDDFTSNDKADEHAFANARAPYIHGSGVLFVSDTPNNRVLGWSDVLNYEEGIAPDIVIGQPDFRSTTAASPPTAASLNQPTGVTMDDMGNLYVADTGNNRVLVFVPTVDQNDPDLIPTFQPGMEADVVIGQPDFTSNAAPNPPTSSSLNQPQGVALDSRYNLVVADTGNNRVLIFPGREEMLVPVETGDYADYVIGQPTEASAESGDMTTNRAPSPPTAVSLNQPTDVAIGAVADTLYVADTGNNRVLVYTKTIPVDGKADYVIGQPDFTSAAANHGGIGKNSLNTPTGLAVDCSNRLYIADTGNNRVLTFFNPQTTSPAADVVFGQGGSFTSGDANQGGVSADGLSAPTGVATDYTTMNAFIADSNNNRVLEYSHPLNNAQPVITELWPGTVEAGSGDIEIEVWGLGIVGDSWDNEGMLVPGSTIQVNGETRGGEYGLTTGGFGLVTISASELTQAGSLEITITTPAPGGGVSAAATLEVFEPAAGDTRADTVLGQPGFNTNDGDFIPPSDNNLFYPNGVAIDPQSGRLFATDSANSRILSWPSLEDLNSGAAADIVIGQPDFTSNLVGLPDWDGTTAATLAYPERLALDEQGNLYVADTENHRVLVYQPPFSIGMDASIVIGQPDFTTSAEHATPTAATLTYPEGLTLDEQGNLYVADTENHRVLVYQPPLSNGMEASSVIGQTDMTINEPATTDSGLNYPTDVAVDSQGNIYVADSENHRVLLFSAGATRASMVFGQGGDFTANTPNNGGVSADSLALPLGVAVDRDDNLYIADRDNERVLFFFAPPLHDTTADQVIGQDSTTTLQVSAAPDASSFRGPVDMSLDRNSQLAVVDNNNSRVMIFDYPTQGMEAPTTDPTTEPTTDPTTEPTTDPTTQPTPPAGDTYQVYLPMLRQKK